MELPPRSGAQAGDWQYVPGEMNRARTVAAVLALSVVSCARCSAPPAVAEPFTSLLEISADPERLSSPEGTALLDAALAADPDDLGTRARVILQNDLWGAAQRLALRGSPSTAGARIGRLAWALAPDAAALAGIDGAVIPPSVRGMLAGFIEHSSEHTTLTHERAFGLRRVFRLLLDGDRRAMVSQLIAFDRDGRAHLTDIAGELERLEFTAETLTAAQVLHLDRPSGTLVEVEHVDQIPSHGATSTIIDFAPAVRVADLPCARCHDDRQMMSLPMFGLDPIPRLRGVIKTAESDLPPRGP